MKSFFSKNIDRGVKIQRSSVGNLCIAMDPLSGFDIVDVSGHDKSCDLCDAKQSKMTTQRFGPWEEHTTIETCPLSEGQVCFIGKYYKKAQGVVPTVRETWNLSLLDGCVIDHSGGMQEIPGFTVMRRRGASLSSCSRCIFDKVGGCGIGICIPDLFYARNADVETWQKKKEQDTPPPLREYRLALPDNAVRVTNDHKQFLGYACVQALMDGISCQHCSFQCSIAKGQSFKEKYGVPCRPFCFYVPEEEMAALEESRRPHPGDVVKVEGMVKGVNGDSIAVDLGGMYINNGGHIYPVVNESAVSK